MKQLLALCMLGGILFMVQPAHAHANDDCMAHSHYSDHCGPG
jgi:hypothetical protein